MRNLHPKIKIRLCLSPMESLLMTPPHLQDIKARSFNVVSKSFLDVPSQTLWSGILLLPACDLQKPHACPLPFLTFPFLLLHLPLMTLTNHHFHHRLPVSTLVRLCGRSCVSIVTLRMSVSACNPVSQWWVSLPCELSRSISCSFCISCTWHATWHAVGGVDGLEEKI